MIYRPFKDHMPSLLGFGCMRLPIVNDDYGVIDEELTAQMVDYAYKHGVNYFDTAYMYHKGNSEIVIGKILNKYPRNTYYLADKFPGFNKEAFQNKEAVFEEQLKKTGHDYFDYYLLHCVQETNVNSYLDKDIGLIPYLIKQKELGRIKHLGFSNHSNLETLRLFLDNCGDAFEFCQLQLNWYDYYFQGCKEKVKLCKERGIKVWVMEPVRGGGLMNIDQKYIDKLNQYRPNITLAEWAFRFVQSLDEVGVILSGMSNMDHIKENIETFNSYKPLSEEEFNVLKDIALDMIKEKHVPCTGCRYCTTKCPKGLDIPTLISIYNSDKNKEGNIDKMSLSTIAIDKRPDNCIGCRSCESICPQNIKISEICKDFVKIIK